jgi:hypothetical protein
MPRIRNFDIRVRNFTDNRVLLYNGSGGYGDQILTWPVARLLNGLGFKVHVLCDPGNELCAGTRFLGLKTS